ncbi:hypothetical protein E2C01_064329 [Portunus trituberculatus]|uniref:Uncharacterized protein n=1 Tax=Portunus trituberculatus TaxID=210409 RepID=A0A5B7HBE2_PORTR|nr:hypothetical protein [Portunus trituberculatus]
MPGLSWLSLSDAPHSTLQGHGDWDAPLPDGGTPPPPLHLRCETLSAGRPQHYCTAAATTATATYPPAPNPPATPTAATATAAASLPLLP